MKRTCWTVLIALVLQGLVLQGAQAQGPAPTPEEAPGPTAAPTAEPTTAEPTTADPTTADPTVAVGAEPTGDPTVAVGAEPAEPTGEPESPHGGHGAHGDLERAFMLPELAEAAANPSLPAGTIRIFVVNASGAPVADADVQLGVLAQGGDRERTPARTNAEGVAEYRDPPTGSRQAYRVNVVAGGATFSSAPFQLPESGGYEAHVRISNTTRDSRRVLLVMGQTFVELRDERLHIMQQGQLSNLGTDTYVFPEDGLRVRLPEGFLVFQAQPVMTDQRLDEVAGHGFRIRGSLPTGTVTLTWAFDVPVTGTEVRVAIENPFRAFRYRVIAAAPPGLELDVDGMPEMRRFEDSGSSFLGAEIQRSPEEEQFSQIVLRLRGIPGPGPARLIAAGLASLFLIGGFFAAFRGSTAIDPKEAKRARARRQESLKAEAEDLERELAKGEVGPEFYARRRGELVREMALLVMQDRTAA